MMHRIRLRPTYAGVTASLALFVAFGGGAYAAAVLPANSVGATQIKKSAVERAKIKNGAVDGSKLLDGSVTGADVKESSLAKVPLADDATHANSTAALDQINYRVANGSAPAGNDSTPATATCDLGQHVIGGGVRVDNPMVAYVDDSYPDSGGTAWTAHIGTVPAGGTNFTVTAICATATALG